MQTRTRNALALAVAGALTAAGLGALWQHRRTPVAAARGPLDAIPSGAMLVATADLDALRASPIGAPLFAQQREIPGLGRVKDVCGFDPLDGVHSVALAVPSAGDGGDFGLVATGSTDAEALVACASKVIQARGGRPVVERVGDFETVRDASLDAGAGEIAVRSGGPVLLGAGAYLRAMVDAAEGRAPSIRTSAAHAALATDLGDGAARIDVVLTPEQRASLADELEKGGTTSSPALAVVSGGLAIRLGPSIGLRAVVTCDDAAACSALAGSLRKARDAHVDDRLARVLGLSDVLARVRIEATGERIDADVAIAPEEASALVDRALTVRAALARAAAAQDEPAATGAPDAPPAPDDVVDAREPADAGAKRDAGGTDAGAHGPTKKKSSMKRDGGTKGDGADPRSEGRSGAPEQR